MNETDWLTWGLYGLLAILFVDIVRRIGVCIKNNSSGQEDDVPRGTWSEQDLAARLERLGLPPSSIFHDLYIQKPNGCYSQIDVLALTSVGIIVFEVKDYSG